MEGVAHAFYDAKLTQTATTSPFLTPDTPKVQGYDFNNWLKDGQPDYDALLSSLKVTGFQASHFGRAVDEINRMLSWRLSDDPIKEEDPDDLQDIESRRDVRCTIFLGYTSNMISSGVREIIRFLCEHKLVSVIVTTAGGIEEDFIKCIAPTYMGEFTLPGVELRSKGLNRIGNLIIPNENYVKLEEWMMPILDKMVEEQKQENVLWSPSKMIARLGKEINNPESVYYWAYKNDIPVFCPALTDGSIGDMIYFHGYTPKGGLVLDIASDIRAMNNSAVYARKSGMIILGGGVIKHHICNANLMRNGADFSVYINTGHEWDGSDTGAAPDEAKSWGKIRPEARPVKLHAEASLVFPLLVAQTFVKEVLNQKKQTAEK